MQEINETESYMEFNSRNDICGFNSYSKYQNTSNLEKNHENSYLIKLQELSNKHGLGKVTYKSIYNDLSPESVFLIDVPRKIEVKDLHGISYKIRDSLNDFAIKSNSCDFCDEIIIGYNLESDNIIFEENYLFNFNPDSSLSYEKNCKSVFMDELKRISKEYGLGKVSYEEEWDDLTLDKTFYIGVNDSWGPDKTIDCLCEIVNHMSRFSKENDIYDYFLRVMISFEL